MTRYTLTLHEEHRRLLENELFNSDGKEYAAFLICGHAKVETDPWTSMPEERFLSREVILIPRDQIVDAATGRVTLKNKAFIHALKKAEAKNFAVALVHSHPDKCNSFSKIDDYEERTLFQLAYNRNGSNRPNLSILFCRDGPIIARAWNSDFETSPVDLIRVIGRRLDLHYEGRGSGRIREAFARQALAFGDALNEDLKALRIAVVGCGGTGSATAMLLARLGVGKLLLIDADCVESTNLNRLHGATIRDAQEKRFKVEVVAESIRNMGLGTEVAILKSCVEEHACHDALKANDVIFGCTDDHLGRTILNRIAYCYATPVIDMGIASDVNDEVRPPEIRTLESRVTYLAKGYTCLLCRKLIDPRAALEEQIRKQDPKRFEKMKIEEYVRGEGNPSPAVVTFTTDIACMAVNELIDRLQGFRGEYGGVGERRRFHKLSEDRRTGMTPRPECPVCQNDMFQCRGDMTPFLDLSL